MAATMKNIRAAIGATRGGLGALSDEQCLTIWNSMAPDDQSEALKAAGLPGARGPVPEPPKQKSSTQKTPETQQKSEGRRGQDS